MNEGQIKLYCAQSVKNPYGNQLREIICNRITQRVERPISHWQLKGGCEWENYDPIHNDAQADEIREQFGYEGTNEQVAEQLAQRYLTELEKSRKKCSASH